MVRGRPQNLEQQEKTRSALLDAACTLLMQKSYRSISIRELAAKAGTQSGMISYYFGNKRGLFEELIKRSAKNRQTKLVSIRADVMNNPDQAFDILVDRIIDVLLGEPWLFKLFHDEVMASDSEIKSFVLSEFSNLSSSGLLRLFTDLQKEGIIREDINLKFFVASFISLVGLPMMTQPLLEEAVGVSLDTVASVEWKQHISDLLSRSVK